MTGIEQVVSNGRILAYIIRGETEPRETSFITPSEVNLQMGFVVYPTGGEVRPHVHLPLERRIQGTAEVLLVRKGRCELDVYGERREKVATYELRQGDVVLLVAGGHGIRMMEDTVFLEVKQGPYTGLVEKERF